MTRPVSANPRISWTIEQLGGNNHVARELGLSASTVSRWTEPRKRGRRPAGLPSIYHLMSLIRLAQANRLSDVDMTWLCDGAGKLDWR